MRTFIAIDVEDKIKKKLSFHVEQFQRLSQGVKWVSEEGMHLTLKFLGEIEVSRANKVENVLRTVCSQCKPFPLVLKGTGYFPQDRRYPRVLWIGVEEQQNLMVLQEKIEIELEKEGFPREERKFHPHLTMGRVKFPSGIHRILEELERLKSENFGAMVVKKITFFQSLLKPSGAEYKIISEFEL